MATRRQGREWALQMLFQADLNPGSSLDMSIPRFWRQQWTSLMEEKRDQGEEIDETQIKGTIEDQVAPPKIRLFTETIVRGVLEHLDEIDTRVQAQVKDWPLHRMGSVERNVLRMSFYELLYCPDVPAPVVMNEAIDLAKYFSNVDAGRFVNGILDKLNKELQSQKKNAE